MGDQDGGIEFHGKIENISEEGLCIRVDSDIPKEYVLEHIEPDLTIHFQAFEEINLNNQDVSDFFEGDATILRVTEVGDEFSIGCHVTSKTMSFDEFVRHKIIERFF